jgi:hypothetical protein
MISVLKLILKPVEKLRDWVKPNYDAMCMNPHVSDRFKLRNKDKITWKHFLYTDPKLMDKFPEFVDWDYIGNSVYSNNDFADLWLKHSDKIGGYKIITNKNPKMAKLIQETVSFESLNDMSYVAMNSNPGLTEYLTKNWKLLPKLKFINRNPKLFNLMMNDPNPCWSNLSGREEPEFSEFLIKNEEHLDLEMIAKNGNPGLTEFIIKLSPKLNMWFLTHNKNPDLLELKKSNKDKLDWNYISEYCKDELLLENLDKVHWWGLSKNENREITETIINNPDKVDYHGLSFNRNKKLIKFKEIHKSKLSYHALCSRSNILEVDNSFYIKLARQL